MFEFRVRHQSSKLTVCRGLISWRLGCPMWNVDILTSTERRTCTVKNPSQIPNSRYSQRHHHEITLPAKLTQDAELLVADDSGGRIWRIHVLTTGPSFQCATRRSVPMFSQALIKLFFPFMASAVLIFIIAISSPAQSNVVLRDIVSVDFRLFRSLVIELPNGGSSLNQPWKPDDFVERN